MVDEKRKLGSEPHDFEGELVKLTNELSKTISGNYDLTIDANS